MHEILSADGQGQRDVHVGGRVPAALRVPGPAARGRQPRAARRTPSERTIVFLDCGNIDRMPVSFLGRDEAHIVNIDHHHDNTRFGTANLVVGRRVVHRRDHLRPDRRPRRRAHAARSRRRCTSALVTDTGKFQYQNTTPAAHRMAAELIEHGVDVARGVPPALRERAVRKAAAAGPRARPRRALRRRPADGLLHQARGLTRRRAPTRTTPRASSTTCAPSRTRWSRRSCASS